MFMCIKSPCYTGHVLFANHFKGRSYFNVLCKITVTLTLFMSVCQTTYSGSFNCYECFNGTRNSNIPLGLIITSATSLQHEKCAMTTGTRI